LRGAIKFVDADHRQQTPTDLNNFGPRIGFAYNVTNKTVIRAAYGIFYMPSALQAAGHSGSAGMLGYNSQSNMIVSVDSNRTPANYLSNPFPNGFNLPVGNSLGDSTFLGVNVGGGNGGVFIDYHTPYVQQWNFNIQRELPGNIVAEVAYIGSKGTRLLAGESGVTLSQLPDSYLSLGSALRDQVANPFYGIITNPSSPLSQRTVERRQLLRAYPQYDGVTGFRIPYGSSIYHGMTLRADKRFSKGTSLLAAYTWNRLIDNVSTTVGFLGQAGTWQNANDSRQERSIGSQDIAHRFVAGFVWDLPVGKGQMFGKTLPKTVNWFAGGWQFNGIATFQSGTPLIISQSQNNVNLYNPGQRPTWNGQDASLSGGSTDQRLQRWFDTTAYSVTPAYTWGSTPRVTSLRADGTKNFDLSFFKNNYFRESKWNAQFRVEMFNALNRTQFAAPNTQVDSGNFGTVTGTANGPRQIQMALKLMF
ncbi:MAG TPA: hypothetical protein VJ302_11915, partial [Blastocatellia bacterium]|nr:hypothetical protein [Blastocatellia bacterium]